jgi:K+-sensing histidine kinase KdpD
MWQPRRLPRWLFAALAGLAAATAATLLLDWVGLSVGTAGWLYLLVVMVVALRFGREEGVITALLAGLLLYGLIIEPRYHWEVHDPRDLVRLAITVGGMVAAALMIDQANRGRLAAERLLAARAEREEAFGRLAFLAEASGVLASTLDYETALRGVARLAVPAITDVCLVDVLDERGVPRRVDAVYADPTLADDVRRLRLDAPDPGIPGSPIARALGGGGAVVISDLVPPAVAAEPAGATACRTGASRSLSLLVVPLLARGRTLGALSLLGIRPGRRHGSADLILAEDLAGRAALAVDNARLYLQAQQGIRVRDELLASTSHELRTPLTHIKGFVSTLRQADVEWDEETRAELLADIERETDRLTRLIGDLLEMSRIETGGMEGARYRPARLSDLVAAGLSHVHGLLGGRRIAVDVPSNLPPVSADVPRFEQVIVNLLENAIKYGAPGGTITINGSVHANEVELAVADEGPGIPPEYLEQVFERFFRVENRARFDIPGTGLGLPICRGIVQAHGGRIRAENRPEGGARFVIRLPAVKDSVGEPEWRGR